MRNILLIPVEEEGRNPTEVFLSVVIFSVPCHFKISKLFCSPFFPRGYIKLLWQDHESFFAINLFYIAFHKHSNQWSRISLSSSTLYWSVTLTTMNCTISLAILWKYNLFVCTITESDKKQTIINKSQQVLEIMHAVGQLIFSIKVLMVLRHNQLIHLKPLAIHVIKWRAALYSFQ